MRFPRWRIFTWVILIFNVVMIIAMVNSARENCPNMTGVELEACQAGTGIGVGILIFLLAAVDVILGILWLITNKKKTRDCPHCGSDVKKGEFVCKKCGFDFRGQTPQPYQQPGPSGVRPQVVQRAGDWWQGDDGNWYHQDNPTPYSAPPRPDGKGGWMQAVPR